MKRLPLKARLARYLEANPNWLAKGTLCDLARAKVGATGEHVGRRMRELENEGVVEVKYVRGHAHYKFKSQQTAEQWFDQLPEQQVSHDHHAG